MALWNKLKDELGRAGRAAQEALDEGKLRLDVMRTRQAMDKAAQKVGYAVYRARKAGGEVPSDEYARLSAEVANAEAEIERLETLAREAAARRKNEPGAPDAPGATEPPAA
jgi:TfoX/Sxy family transcriptional regulator of competence genes